jgi:hypothetical protein
MTNLNRLLPGREGNRVASYNTIMQCIDATVYSPIPAPCLAANR